MTPKNIDISSFEGISKANPTILDINIEIINALKELLDKEIKNKNFLEVKNKKHLDFDVRLKIRTKENFLIYGNLNCDFFYYRNKQISLKNSFLDLSKQIADHQEERMKIILSQQQRKNRFWHFLFDTW
jgi:hypothetical protein